MRPAGKWLIVVEQVKPALLEFPVCQDKYHHETATRILIDHYTILRGYTWVVLYVAGTVCGRSSLVSAKLSTA